MAKRKRKARTFKVGDCVQEQLSRDPSVGRVLRAGKYRAWHGARARTLYTVKFFGELRPSKYTGFELKHAACTRSTPLAGTKRRRRK